MTCIRTSVATLTKSNIENNVVCIFAQTNSNFFTYSLIFSHLLKNTVMISEIEETIRGVYDAASVHEADVIK